MDEYIKKSEAVDVIVKYPYNIAGKTATAIKMIEDLPSADVVPKSEVEALEKEIERLKHILDCYALQYGTVKEQQAVIDKANQEFASEIFEKVEKIILDNTYPDFNREHKPVNIWKAKTGYDAFDELKKKYTEGEDKPAATEEKYFSPDDVRKMTNQEVREKYTAIRKSMEMW